MLSLKGKKIRVHSASLGDYVEGAGGTSVTMSFGEVLPALQKGVVDCAITDAMSAYRGKWPEVIKHAVPSKLAYSVSFTAVSTKSSQVGEVGISGRGSNDCNLGSSRTWRFF